MPYNYFLNKFWKLECFSFSMRLHVEYICNYKIWKISAYFITFSTVLVMVGTSTFQAEWTDINVCSEFAEWVRPSPKGDKTSAYCKLCNKVFDVSNMGRQALVSHAKSKKHFSIQKGILSIYTRYF